MKKYEDDKGNVYYGIREDERDRIESYGKGITMLVSIEKQLNSSFAGKWNANDEKGLAILNDHVINQVNDLREGPQSNTLSKMLQKLPYNSDAWDHIEQLGLLPDRTTLPTDPNVAEFFDLDLESDDFMVGEELKAHRRQRFVRREENTRTGSDPMRKRV